MKYQKHQKVFYTNSSGDHDFRWGTVEGFYEGSYVIKGWYDTQVIPEKLIDQHMKSVRDIVFPTLDQVVEEGQQLLVDPPSRFKLWLDKLSML